MYDMFDDEDFDLTCAMKKTRSPVNEMQFSQQILLLVVVSRDGSRRYSLDIVSAPEQDMLAHLKLPLLRHMYEYTAENVSDGHHISYEPENKWS